MSATSTCEPSQVPSTYIHPMLSGKVRSAAVRTLSAASVRFPVLLIEHPAGTAADQFNPDTMPPATIQQHLSVGRTTAGEIRQDAGEQGPRPPVRTPQREIDIDDVRVEQK
ncbi:hypothetical protein ACFWGI_32485 [Streptomyces niveus]|uniref:hypothetical protein n=1 Tax=Streptomyces niveus TaxID=193462 RepID=UPI0036656C09